MIAHSLEVAGGPIERRKFVLAEAHFLILWI
jgi:hypothetical protein